MSFTSLNFLVFLAIVVFVNYCIPNRYRWLFLLCASGFFYINWQPVYAILLLSTSTITYFTAQYIAKSNSKTSRKKVVCIIGCILPLFALGIFKYYNFITQSVFSFLSTAGFYMALPKLELLMPIGISFYTFTAVGYLIDIYKHKYQPENNFGITCLFIAFFPQISSGPIPRGDKLIPQLKNPSNISYDNVIGGLRTLIWGFFMKLCVADRLGIYVDAVYDNINQHNGGSLFLASLLYSIQIYCDFAGYSLMAIGTARMLGIQLMDNFKRPYFATNIKDFWSRWHISLSTWFRDYVYIPLGGNRVSKRRNIFNLIATFLLSGLWHGAAWNFILWGGMHGVGQSIEKISSTAEFAANRHTPPRFVKICLMFIVINFLWVFFRLQSVSEISTYFVKITTDIAFPFIDMTLVYGLLSFSLLLVKDLIDEYRPHVKLMSNSNLVISSASTGVLVAIILLFGVFDSSSFIYFQF